MSRVRPPMPVLYDDPVFFAGYRKMRDEDSGLNGSLEQPAVWGRLGSVAGLDILDLGCGFGDFLRDAARQRPRSMVGIDQSARMISEARARSKGLPITFQHMDIVTFRASPETLDLVVSSMALHYVEDYAGVVAAVHGWLRPGGRFLLTVEHPVCTANPVGWTSAPVLDSDVWPLDRYQDEGPRTTRWYVDDVRKYHRTVETYINTLLARGFELAWLGEPKPLRRRGRHWPDFSQHMRRPPVLLIDARKPAPQAMGSAQPGHGA